MANLNEFMDTQLDDQGVKELNQIIVESYCVDGQYKALTMLDSMIERYPKSPQLRISRGILLVTHNIYEKIHCYEDAIELDSSFYDGYRRLARATRASAFGLALYHLPIPTYTHIAINKMATSMVVGALKQADLQRSMDFINSFSDPSFPGVTVFGETVISKEPFLPDFRETWKKSIDIMELGWEKKDSRYPDAFLNDAREEIDSYRSFPDTTWKYMIVKEYVKVMGWKIMLKGINILDYL